MVLIETVLIAFTDTYFNGATIFAADIHDLHLQYPSSQKNYIICGPEFVIENMVKIALINKAFYGGKSAGCDFRDHLRSCMRHLEYSFFLAEPEF